VTARPVRDDVPSASTTTGPSLPRQVSPPEFALSDLGPEAIAGVEVIALPVLTGEDSALLGPGAAGVAEALDLDLLEVADVHGVTGKVGQVASVPVPRGIPANRDLRLVLLVGVGEGRPVDVRRAGAALAREVRDRDVVATSIPMVVADDAATGPTAQVEAAIEAFVPGVMLASFGFHWRSAGPEHRPVRRVVLASAAVDDRSVLDRALAVGGAGWTARYLATVPSNVKNPEWLAEQARMIAAEHDLECTVWDETALANDGFGGILAVGQGSATPPRLIRLDYTPAGLSARAARRRPRVVLVGKGITFDTGGLSIKPGQGMTTMKRDMTGGGVVIATMAALAAVDCPVRVTGLVPAAENAVSGSSTRPGDVVRHWDGTTTEITNTDAEGRVVLADAIGYAAAELDPSAIIDVATLTGAVRIALGQHLGSVFTDDDALAAALTTAGDRSGEPLWRLPLYAGYRDRLDSKVADLDNAPGHAGAITAALFLQHFAGDVPWAHLDIASVGDVEKDRHEWTAGPSGFGARLLLDWLGGADPLGGVGRES
jgi:leucyl aminopeptidase